MLRDGGFVEASVDAQRRLYRLKPDSLQAVDKWLAPFRRFWTERVEAIERQLDRINQRSRTIAFGVRETVRRSGAKGGAVNFWIRQTHRWVSIVFTITVIANFVAIAMASGGMPPAWITYSPLLPLAIFMFSGLYLFILPYTAKRRAGRTA